LFGAACAKPSTQRTLLWDGSKIQERGAFSQRGGGVYLQHGERGLVSSGRMGGRTGGLGQILSKKEGKERKILGGRG